MPAFTAQESSNQTQSPRQGQQVELKGTDFFLVTAYVPDYPAPNTATLPYCQSMFIFRSTTVFSTELLHSLCHCTGFLHSRGATLQLSLFCSLGFLPAHPSSLPDAPGSGHGFKRIGCMYQPGVPWKFSENELWPLLHITVKTVRQERSWKKSQLASR